MKSLKEVLDKNYMGRLDAMDIMFRKKMQQNAMGGARKSNAKGVSMEFSDFRDYVLGDDLRRVDWNSYGRFDRLYLKLFMEERQAAVNIFLDNSPSMAFYENKCLYSKLAAASIAYITLKNTDRLNLFAFCEAVNGRKKNCQSKNSFLQVVDFLDDLSCEEGETALGRALSEETSRGLPRGLSVIISDFFSKDGYKEAVKHLQSLQQEILLIQVLAKEEAEPAFSGNVRLIDRENGAGMDLEMNHSVMEAYRRTLHSFQTDMMEFCYKRGIRFLSLVDTMDVLKALSSVL